MNLEEFVTKVFGSTFFDEINSVQCNNSINKDHAEYVYIVFLITIINISRLQQQRHMCALNFSMFFAGSNG